MASKNWVKILKEHSNPIIEGNRATILWQGNHPPQLICDLNYWDDEHPFDFKPLGTNIWGISLDLTMDAYFEYAFIRDGERIPDPNNPKKTPNGMGKFNQYFYMPDGKPSTLTHRKKSTPPGKIIKNRLDTLDLIAGKTRQVTYYQPPVKTPVPLVVVFDGKDYLNRARLPIIIDNLIATEMIHPVALAMMDNGRQYRMMEYACSEAMVGFLDSILLPDARKQLNILDVEKYPRSYGIMGASMGGLMALYTALRLPHVFGTVLSQSGAFSIHGYDFVIWDLIRCLQTIPVKIWMDCGIYEFLLEPNRRMVALLNEKNNNFVYQEFHAGHNYPAWRNHLAEGLINLYPIK